MAFINEATGDIHFKILYIGCQNSGKTTNLQSIFLEKNKKPKEKTNFSVLKDLPRNNFFDFLPLSYKTIANRKSRMHLYTLPSNQLWPSVNINLMLGVDGIIHIIDSRMRYLEKYNVQSQNLKNLMNSLQIDENKISTVYQFNHSDSYDALPFLTLKETFNLPEEDCIQAVAVEGIGVMETFLKLADKIVSKIV
jgi:signal recognition particle receptor subunit beta